MIFSAPGGDSIPRPGPSQWKVVSRSHSGCSQRAWRGRHFACLLAAGLVFPCGILIAQSAQPDSGDASAPSAPPVAVHGQVKNAVTGEPLPRVLVLVEGQSETGVLTDGDGRFEIPGVSTGSATIQLARPGFEDEASPSHSSMVWANNRGIPHTVTVTEPMPDLEFAMRPLNAIRGHIELSNGDSPDKITVELLGQSTMDGRPQWHVVTNAVTNSDGVFRFGGLSDGTYAVVTEPSLDGLDGALALLRGKAPTARDGYAQVFYPDARNFSGAATIPLAGGQTAPANFILKQETFHLVRASVSGPGMNGAGAGSQVGGGTFTNTGSTLRFLFNGINAQVMDTAGHDLPYPAQYDAETHSIQAMLPDGDYTLRVTSLLHNGGPGIVPSMSIAALLQESIAGQADVSVNGHAITNARIALGPMSLASLQLNVNRTGTEAQQPAPSGSGPVAGGGAFAGNQNGGGGIFISATPAGASMNSFDTQFAQGGAPGPLEISPLAPGSYWMHTTIAQQGLCEASFTAGGANLAREPLVVGQSGSTAPLTLTLRDDCAALKLALPSGARATTTGEAPAYTVYVVPDFDSTTRVQPLILRPGFMASTSIENLTPGAYRVYTFKSPIDLPYRDPDAMAALNVQGQAVTLSPGATLNLVLEVPAP